MKSNNKKGICWKVKRKTKVFFRQILRKVWGFDKWHVSPIEERDYAYSVINAAEYYISSYRLNGDVVEIGCGLGDIIGRVKCNNQKVGYDISKEVISCGRYIHPFVKFRHGTFEDVSHKDIACLIMVNFIHSISEEKLKESVRQLVSNNSVELIIIDVLEKIENSQYAYSHSGESILGSEFVRIQRVGPFEAEGQAKRYIEIYKKRWN